MSTGDTNDPQHWRDRAAQMRSLAVKMAGSEAAILMQRSCGRLRKASRASGDQGQWEKAAIEWQAALGGVDFAGCRSTVWACGRSRFKPRAKLEPVLSVTIRTRKRE